MHDKSNKLPFHIGLVIKPVLTVLQNLSYSVIVIVGFMYGFVNRLDIFSYDLIGGMNMIGSVYALKYDKNYGFIYVDGGKQYFFHKNELKNCTMYQLNEGDVVEFDIKE